MTLAPDNNMETGQPSSHYHLKSTLLIVLSFYLLYRISGRLYKTYRIRSRYRDIPSLPRHPIWGNLINAGRHFNPALKRHPDYGFEEMWQELGQPGCFLLDVTPVQDRGLLILAEPQCAEVLVQPSEEFKYSLPKDPGSSKLLKPLMGAEGINAQEGSHWRAIRKRFNPGFQPQHLRHLLDRSRQKSRSSFIVSKSLQKTGLRSECRTMPAISLSMSLLRLELGKILQPRPHQKVRATSRLWV